MLAKGESVRREGVISMCPQGSRRCLPIMIMSQGKRWVQSRLPPHSAKTP